MTTFFKKQEFNTVASLITSLMLVSGCRSASVNSNPGGNLPPGGLSAPPFYRPAEPYDSDSNESTTPQPVPPSVLPEPGHTDPEIPPAPTTSKSRWKFIPSSFKLPSLSRQGSDVRQMGAKFIAKAGKKTVTPTLREDESEVVEETVSARSAAGTAQSELPELKTDAVQPTQTPNSGAANPASVPRLLLPND